MCMCSLSHASTMIYISEFDLQPPPHTHTHTKSHDMLSCTDPSNRTNHSKTGTSSTMSQNKQFFPYGLIIAGICHSDRKLTNTGGQPIKGVISKLPLLGKDGSQCHMPPSSPPHPHLPGAKEPGYMHTKLSRSWLELSGGHLFFSSSEACHRP
jgi:hypothetical protein